MPHASRLPAFRGQHFPVGPHNGNSLASGAEQEHGLGMARGSWGRVRQRRAGPAGPSRSRAAAESDTGWCMFYTTSELRRENSPAVSAGSLLPTSGCCSGWVQPRTAGASAWRSSLPPHFMGRGPSPNSEQKLRLFLPHPLPAPLEQGSRVTACLPPSALMPLTDLAPSSSRELQLE